MTKEFYFGDRFGHVWGPWVSKTPTEALPCLTEPDLEPHTFDELIIMRGYDGDSTEPWLRTWRERPLYTRS